MRKVAFFITSVDSGGIENYLLRFITHFEDELNVSVYCKSNRLGELENEYRLVGAKLIPIKIGFYNFIEYYKLYKILKKENYDSVCDFTGNFSALTLLASLFAGIPKRIVFFRGSTNHFKKNRINSFYNNVMNKLLLNVGTKILSNSYSAFIYFFKEKWKGNKKFEVIYNGIDSKKFLSTNKNLRSALNIPDNAFVVGHVGRYNVAKNHDTIIKVAKEMCKLYEDVYFIIAGKNTNCLYINKEKKYSTQIKVLGFRKDVVKIYNSLDCFLFPSLTEGQPNALIEALISGIPIVASNIESIKESVPESLYEYLFDPKDIKNFISKIKEIKKHPHNSNNLKFKNWAISNYNHELLFKKFYNIL